MSRDWKTLIPFLQAHRRACLPGPELPDTCCCCGLRLLWGWMDDELWAAPDPDAVQVHRIPRPDQTVFCPRCEGRILN